MDKPPTVVAADIGSINEGNFGWASNCGKEGKDICKLADFVADELRAGRRVALGFECPLWVPIPKHPEALGKMRCGERGFSFAAWAGATALVTGLTQVSWVLRRIRERTSECHIPAFSLKWSDFEKTQREGDLLLWEAFVAGEAKAPREDPESHVKDARTALDVFCKAFGCKDLDPAKITKITKIRANGEPVLSLIGAALLWAGWSTDTKLLCTPCCGVGPNPR